MEKRKFLFIIPVIILIYIISNVVSICTYSNVYEDKECDVAIVLGAACNDTEVSEVYKQRLNHAIKLYNEGEVKKLIVTGGIGAGNTRSDADVAAEYLTENNIPLEDIFKEDKSTITQENLEYSKTIMDNNKFKTALIVSDPLHMKRSMLLSKDCDIDAFSSPTDTSAYKTLKSKIPFVARETFFYIGYKWYKLLN